MPRTINESIETLDTSLDTIKEKLSEHLTEGGGMPEQLKVSEIPGYLDQIESGGSGGFNYIEDVTLDGHSITESTLTSGVYIDYAVDFNLTFTPKEDGLLLSCPNYLEVTPDIGETHDPPAELQKGTEYTVTGSSTGGVFYALIYKYPDKYNMHYNVISPIDSIIKIAF